MKGSALRALIVMGLLAAIQLAAFALQIANGFRPFAAPPRGRVPFSWDMFAIRIERCDVAWSPPLSVAGKPVASLAEASGFEWVYVQDNVDAYRRVARASCAFRSAPDTRALLRCALPDGTLTREELACPPPEAPLPQ